MKKFLFFASVLMALVPLRGQDTVGYGYPDYYFNGFDSVSLYFHRPAWPYFDGCQYYFDTPTMVYGIVLALKDPAIYTPAYAMLIVPQENMSRDKVTFDRLDSVAWENRNPDKYYRHAVKNCDEIWEDSIVPLYEFYFQCPVLVSDTFYVGLRSVPNSRAIVYQPYDVCKQTTTWGTWLTLFTWDGSYSTGDTLQRPPEWLPCSILGGAYPILAPNRADTAATDCPAVENFALQGHYSDLAWFTWDTVGMQSVFQLAVAQGETPPEEGMMKIPSQQPCYFSGLDSNATYGAYIRTQCGTLCNGPDSSKWGAWCGPIYFTNGDSNAGTESVVFPAGQPPAFDLAPNPASGAVTVTVSENVLLPAEVAVSDASGKEVLRRTMRDRTCRLDTLPAGIYFVTLGTKQGSSTQKLVVN